MRLLISAATFALVALTARADSTNAPGTPGSPSVTNNATGGGFPANPNGNGLPNPNVNPNGNAYPNPNGNSIGNGDNSAPKPTQGLAHTVLKFNAADPHASSAVFNVSNHWQLFWYAPTGLYVTVLTPDGRVVAGSRAHGHGSLYLGKGGSYYLQVDSIEPNVMQWFFVAAEMSTGSQLADSEGGAQMTGENPYRPPDTPLPPSANGTVSPSVVQNNGHPPNAFGQPWNPSQQNMGTPSQPPAPAAKLTDDQARAIVLIKGDNAEGTGFLVKNSDGPQVVTNIHVIANNPNLKITTNTGAFVKVLSMKAASDRDLALLSIQDAGYSYLEVSHDISQNVQPGDEVITPGNSQGGEVMLNTAGHVLGVGPERIEFDNPIYHGNSGGPVFHVKSGKVLGVVTEAMKVDVSDDLDKASFASRNSAISGAMRYFGLRLDTVSSWIPVDSQRFQIETAFLDQFHEQSRRLDSLLNQPPPPPPRSYYGQPQQSAPADDSTAKLYLSDDKIVKALRSYADHTADGDVAEIADSKRQLLFDLQSIADTNVMQIENPQNFYSFDQDRARDELAYRKALKAELDEYGSNIDRMPRSYGLGGAGSDNN